MGLLSERDCRELVERVLAFSKADEVRVTLTQDEVAHQRFARNVPSTAGLVDERTIAVRSTFGARSGTASGNQLDPAVLEGLVRRSEAMARLAPEDPEFLPALGPQDYAHVPAGPGESEEERLERIATGVGGAIGRARRAGLVAAGFVQAREGVRCLANSAGLFGYHRHADAHFSTTVRTPDGRGSGWGSTAAVSAGGLDFDAPAAAAIEKARRSVGARTLAPEAYPAVLEPACVASLLELLVRGMDLRRADEGRSFFSLAGDSTRLGERLFPDAIELRSDPADPRVPGTPWGSGGLPHRPTAWIEDGVVANLHCERFWARERGHPALPYPPNQLLAGGDATLEELIGGTERGVLVTNLWYIRGVDPQTMLYTGLTRDGVFWIEDGQLTHPVNNFRWNDSPVRVLQNVEALSRPVRVGGRNGRTVQSLVPALRVSEFGFSSISEAV